MRSLLLVSLLFLFSACKVTVKEQQADPVQRKLNSAVKQSCKNGQCPCETPVGMINHGSKVVVYDKDSVSCIEACGTYAKELTCDNGELSEDISGKYFKCFVQECPNCELDGNRVLHGETITAFSKRSADCSESCDDFKEFRKCNMGKLEGNPTFSFGSCQRRDCRCKLPDNSAFISYQGKQKFYSKNQLTLAECGKTCDKDFSQERTCDKAPVDSGFEFALNGSPDFQFLTCKEPQGCYCTLPNGLGVLDHGLEKTISKQESAACGQKCDASLAITVKCDNGRLVNKMTNQALDFTASPFQEYKYFCAEASDSRPCKCKLQDGSFVAVGSKTPFYEKPIGTCGSSCAAIAIEKTCKENKVGSNYVYVFEGDTNYAFEKCSEAVVCNCSLPGTLGSLYHGGLKKLYSKEKVACEESCANYAQDVKCVTGALKQASNPSLDADLSVYKYQCTQATCNSCKLAGWGTIQPGVPQILYPKSEMDCDDDPNNLKRTFSCESGILHRNGEPYDPASDPLAVPQWYNSFIVKCPGCTLPWGGILREGAKVNAYKNFGTVVNGCGRGCRIQERRCINGVLTGDSEYNLGQCNNTCNEEGGGAPPRLCLMRWQNTWVTPDAQVPMWSKKVVGCNDSCQNYFKLGTCKMLKGTFNAPFEFMYPSCTEVCP